MTGRRLSPVVRDGLGMGLATGAYGLSFGALSVAGGLSVAQTGTLSLLMFTGASQFAFVGVLAGGGGPVAAAATALLLGSRNGLYGLHLSRLLGLRGWRRPLGAHLVIDESAGMAVRQAEGVAARTAFWATGLAVFVCWNVATLAGALGAHALSDPGVLGLDVVAPAAFLALLAPRMRTVQAWLVALAAGTVALVSTPFVPAGVPVLLAALPALPWALAPGRRSDTADVHAIRAEVDAMTVDALMVDAERVDALMVDAERVGAERVGAERVGAERAGAQTAGAR
jgi:predicted branched-subunit amino acid permease